MERLPYRQVWLVDFEFTALMGERPVPLCAVAQELRSGKLVRRWLADNAPGSPPYETGADSLFIAYYASAEIGCHLALGWPVPSRVLDLCVEFKNHTCGLAVPFGRDLLGALAYYGLDGLQAAEKISMRELAMRGGPYTAPEKLALLDYCQTDVESLSRLLPVMLPNIDLPRALLRGRYMAAAARIEWTGIPIDVELLTRLRQRWSEIKGRLVATVNQDYGVFVPVGKRTIRSDSRLGCAILQQAESWNIDPYRLAQAVDFVWAEERETGAEILEARKAARRATWLTVRRINAWESSGRDYSLYPGLDTTSRELAGTYPALGIGQGYDPAAPDDDDTAGRLWDLLRNDDDRVKPKHDHDILRRAAEMVASCPSDTPDYFRAMRFSIERWSAYLARQGIPWPRLECGALALDDDTFREMARTYPAQVAPIRELRHSLGQLRLNDLSVGSDGRNRCLLSAFASRTGRNQPSNSKFIFGPSCWLRSIIKPEWDRAVAYCDWSAQELGIAAALSGDQKMQAAYESGDPYLYLAKSAGVVPPDATKTTHPSDREQFKVVSLGVLYGLSAEGLARKLGLPACHGQELFRMHRETYRRFWRWSDEIEMKGMLLGRLQTVFGWTLHIGPNVNPRTLRNFPMQANGAEMLRLACCLATERGIAVAAPIHDALLVEGPADEIENVVAEAQSAMREASELVLPGFPLRTDAKIVRWPDRYMDPRGERMWKTITELLEATDGPDTPTMGATPITGDTPSVRGSGPLPPVVTPSSLMSCI